VPAHAGGQVVDAEEILEFLRLRRPSLHGVEQRELPVQQGLAAPGQVTEDVTDAAPEPGLPGRGLDRGLLHRRECLPDLADLVGPGRDRRGIGGYVDILADAGGTPAARPQLA